MLSDASTVQGYIDSLDSERREVFLRLRSVIAENLPAGFEEVMAWGMPAWVVPLKRFPEGYLGNPEQPLPLISIAWQKRHLAFYHMGLYSEPELLKRFLELYEARVGKKADMGKSCLRFTRLDAIPYDLIGEVAAWFDVDRWVRLYRSQRTLGGRKTSKEESL